MELDLAQFGQNVALNISERPPERVLDGFSPLQGLDTEGQNKSEIETEKDQVLQAEADIQEESDKIAPDLTEAVEQISDYVNTQNRDLTFSVDEKSRKQVVIVTDSGSGEVIRQIPSEEALALAERIKELQTDVGSAVGVLFNKQV